jgi:hypothetical protein
MTKTQQSEAIERLRETLKPGDTVFTVLKHVSRSGMMRVIQLIKMVDGEPRYLGYNAHLACGIAYDEKREGLRMGGCGMDMGFAAVYELSSVLFRGGFSCTGDKCPSNDHNNAYYATKEGNCLICGAKVGKSTYKRGRWPVCSQACASGEWIHKSGGYALNHRWL